MDEFLVKFIDIAILTIFALIVSGVLFMAGGFIGELI